MSYGGVFRLPPNIRPVLGVVAVLFPAPPNPDVLVPPPSSQMAAAGVREAPFSVPRGRLYPSQLFPQAADPAVFVTPPATGAAQAAYRDPLYAPPTLRAPYSDALFAVTPSLPFPPLPVQQLAAAAWRPPAQPYNPFRPLADALDLYESDSAVGQGDVQGAAHTAWREVRHLPQPLRISNGLLAILSATPEVFPFPPLPAQQMAAAGLRPDPFPRQKAPYNPLAGIDAPPLFTLALQQAMAGLREVPYAVPRQAPSATWVEWLTTPQAPPLRSLAGQLGVSAWSEPWRRGAGPDARLLPFNVVTDAPPLLAYPAQLAHAAWRPEGAPQRLPLLFSPAVFGITFDSPPLASAAGRLAALAYREPGRPHPLPMAFPPSIFPPVVDAPPLLGMAQALAQAAWRAEGYPWAIYTPGRIRDPFGALFPAAIPPTTEEMLVALTAAVAAMQIDMRALMARRFNFDQEAIEESIKSLRSLVLDLEKKVRRGIR